MANIKLVIIPEPASGTASILAPTKLPAIKADGPDNLLCGSYGSKLCESIGRDQIKNIVFKCPDCGSFNFKS